MHDDMTSSQDDTLLHPFLMWKPGPRRKTTRHLFNNKETDNTFGQNYFLVEYDRKKIIWESHTLTQIYTFII